MGTQYAICDIGFSTNPQVHVCKTQRKRTSRIVPVCYDFCRRSFARGFTPQAVGWTICEDIQPFFIPTGGRGVVYFALSSDAVSPPAELRWQGWNVRNVLARVQCFGGTAPRKGPKRACKYTEYLRRVFCYINCFFLEAAKKEYNDG
jgi:hypothetical protein